jgi:SAM-dependent methyltransferase
MEEARKRAAVWGATELLEDLYDPRYAYLKQGDVTRLWSDILLHNKDQTPEFTCWRNSLSVRLVPRAAKKILEIGVGMGRALQELAKRVPSADLYGTDLSPQAIASAAGRFKGHFAVAEPGQLPWPGAKFDAILMLEVLEHVEVPRTLRLLRWVRRILVDSGCLVISVPLESVADLRKAHFLCPHCGEYVHQIGHLRSYSELEPIRMELALSGFRLDRAQGIAGGKYFGIPRQRLMPFFPNRIKPMVMVFRCMKQGS